MGVGTGPADPAAGGPIIRHTGIFVFTLYHFREREINKKLVRKNAYTVVD